MCWLWERSNVWGERLVDIVWLGGSATLTCVAAATQYFSARLVTDVLFVWWGVFRRLSGDVWFCSLAEAAASVTMVWRGTTCASTSVSWCVKGLLCTIIIVSPWCRQAWSKWRQDTTWVASVQQHSMWFRSACRLETCCWGALATAASSSGLYFDCEISVVNFLF